MDDEHAPCRESIAELRQKHQDRQEELLARIRKFTNGSEISMNVKDIREALGAVAELVGIEL